MLSLTARMNEFTEFEMFALEIATLYQWYHKEVETNPKLSKYLADRLSEKNPISYVFNQDILAVLFRDMSQMYTVVQEKPSVVFIFSGDHRVRIYPIYNRRQVALFANPAQDVCVHEPFQRIERLDAYLRNIMNTFKDVCSSQPQSF